MPAERLERGIAELAARVERITTIGADPLGRGEMAKRVNEIRSLLGDPIAQDGALQLLERRLGSIADRVDAMFGERLDSMLAAGHDPSAKAPDVDAMMSDLGARIDRALSGGLQAMERNVARMMEGATPSDAHASRLETMVRDLAARIDVSAAPDASAEALDAMNKQIEQLAKHFDRNDKTADSLVALQQSVGDLFARLEQGQVAAVDAAHNAARDAAAEAMRDFAETSPDMSRELSDIRALQDAADHRTHSTLTAVHDTLSKVVDRLSSLESDFADNRTGASMPFRGLQENAARPKMATDGSTPDRRKAPVLGDGEADVLIEPGQVFDRRRAAGATDSRTDRPQASFIQAARRAAKAASVAIESAGEPAVKTAASRSAAPLDQVRAYYASRKRPILLSLAALMVVAGAFQVAKVATNDRSPAPTPSTSAQPKVSMRDKASDKPVASASSVSMSDPVPAADAPAVVPAQAQALAPARRADLSPPPETAAAPAVAVDRLPVGSIARPEQTSDSNGAVRALAVSGDPAAQFELAVRYADGKLLSRDLKLSQQWFEKAAAKGIVPAQYRLGALYERGIGVNKDPALAKQWYLRAADAGNARAMHNLAVLFADGAGGKPDYAEAISWFRRAAELGVRDSQYNLAILYARGMGTAPNMVESYVWFATAAAQGDEDSGRKRDDVAARLPANDLARAKALFAAYKPKIPNPAANDVTPPPGGWEAAKPSAIDAKSVRPKVSGL